MPPFTLSRVSLARGLSLALGVIIMALLTVAQVSANGPHVRSQEVFAGIAGPYDLRVVTAPVVGDMHITIHVAQTVGGGTVTDARIQVSGKGPRDDSQAVGPVPASSPPGTPDWYGVNLPIQEAGDWVFTLTVESPLGKETVDFPVKVGKSGGIDLFVIGILVALLAAVAWWALSWIRGKGRRGETHKRDCRRR